MGRFDIYRNPGKSKQTIPYLLDVQSDSISGLATRIVIPLRSLEIFQVVQPPADLCPVIQVEGKDYFLDTAQLGAIPVKELKDYVDSAQGSQLRIVAALDKVFGAY
ncbi:MAG TPA: plasmid maintenance protein CcdB [Oxalobacteraceae bacterium]|nr:plasmid maintenance protein CcdB [Oxalobacteraceae bacterium]